MVSLESWNLWESWNPLGASGPFSFKKNELTPFLPRANCNPDPFFQVVWLQTRFGGGAGVDFAEGHDDRLAEESILGFGGGEQSRHGPLGPGSDPIEGLG